MADTKISALPSAASVADTDLIPIVADPSGTPATKKATRAVLLAGQAAKSGVEGFVDATADNDAARPTGFARVRWLAADSANPPTNAAVDDVIEYENEAAPYTSASADTAATADKLVLRDASGRAQVADPAVAADIATKGYVDTAVAGAGGGGGGAGLDIVGAWYPSASGNNTNYTLTQDRVYAVPRRIPSDMTLGDLGVWVGTAVASATVRVGIAANDDSGLPGTVLFEAGGLDASATGFKKASGLGAVAETLTAGEIVYFLLAGQTASGIAVAGVQSFDADRPIAGPGTDPLSGNPGGSIMASGFSGSFGASLAGSTWSQNTAAPIVYLKRSA